MPPPPSPRRLPDAPSTIPDPAAQLPAGWDVEEDGEWEAPRVSNPACDAAPGCGPWERPTKPNPAYKGPWVAPRVPNPAYKGPWLPRRIPNPAVFHDDALGLLQGNAIGAVAVEVWTMQGGIGFTNFLLTRSEAAAGELQAAWHARNAAQQASAAMAASLSQLAALKDAAEHGTLSAKAQYAILGTIAALKERPAIAVTLAVAGLGMVVGSLWYLMGVGAGASGSGHQHQQQQRHQQLDGDEAAQRRAPLTREQIESLRAQVLGESAPAATGEHADNNNSEEEATPPVSTASSKSSKSSGKGGAVRQQSKPKPSPSKGAPLPASDDDGDDDGSGGGGDDDGAAAKGVAAEGKVEDDVTGPTRGGGVRRRPQRA